MHELPVIDRTGDFFPVSYLGEGLADSYRRPLGERLANLNRPPVDNGDKPGEGDKPGQGSKLGQGDKSDGDGQPGHGGRLDDACSGSLSQSLPRGRAGHGWRRHRGVAERSAVRARGRGDASRTRQPRLPQKAHPRQVTGPAQVTAPARRRQPFPARRRQRPPARRR